jgi:hypothetical protein
MLAGIFRWHVRYTRYVHSSTPAYIAPCTSPLRDHSRQTQPMYFSRSATLLLLFCVTACREQSTAPRGFPAPRSGLGLVEVTISGIGGPAMSASAVSTPRFGGGPLYSLAGAANADASAAGTIQLDPLATASFTTGVRGSGGYRYLHATFRVRNAQSDGTAYDFPRRNLTLFAVSTPTTLGGTAFVSMRRFGGALADPTLAPQMLPTGLVSPAPFTGTPTSASGDVLQVITEDEAAGVSAPAGVVVLPYGFVVRSAASGGRTLPASPAEGQYDGLLTVAFRLPLQATAADDPFTITLVLLAQDDSETRISQSLEEQTPAGQAAFLARAAQIGATMKTVLPGLGGYAADGGSTRTICSVRTVGTRASPTAFLVHRTVSSVTLAPLANWPLWAGGSVMRRLHFEARDGAGVPMADIPVQLSFGTPGVLAVSGPATVGKLPRLDRASCTVIAAACGVASIPRLLRTSGFIPLEGGDLHSLAIRSDGTVAAWGSNVGGETSTPPGLASVAQAGGGAGFSVALRSDGTMAAWGAVPAGFPAGLAGVSQIAVGAHHALALLDDGTVVAWGLNDAGQASVPAGLGGIVQVAAGSNHSLALRGDGTVVAWGLNEQGESSVPPGLTDVVQIAGGGFHSLALRADGSVVAWGANTSGQSTVPAGLEDVVQIAAGSLHSLALRSDGTVVGWGENGQLQRTIPPGLVAVHIAAGASHSLAVDGAGTVTAWGWNGDGQATPPAGLVAAIP